MELDEFELTAQMKELATRYFPQFGNNLPVLKIKRTEDEKHGPAWLEVVAGVPANKRTGTIYIDDRVSSFRTKTTKILILHELIHYGLYLKDGETRDIEGEQFDAELYRIKRLGAYVGLL